MSDNVSRRSVTQHMLRAQLDTDPTKFLRNMSRHAMEYGSEWVPEAIRWFFRQLPDHRHLKTLDRAMAF